MNGGIWDSSHDNVVLWRNQETESKDEIFVGQDTVWKATRYYDPKVKISLSPDWQEILKTRYDVKVIDIEKDLELSDEHAE